MVSPQSLAAMAALLVLTACGPKASAPPPQGRNVVLTAEQRQKITLYTIAQGQLPQGGGHQRHGGFRQ